MAEKCWIDAPKLNTRNVPLFIELLDGALYSIENFAVCGEKH